MATEPREFPHDAAGGQLERPLSPRQLLQSFEALLETEALTRAVLIDALVRKADGVILIGQRGDILFINATASAILREADGLTFRDGRFLTARSPETRQLHSAIRDRLSAPETSERRPARVIATRPSGKAPYIVCVSHPPAGAAVGDRSCVVHIVDLSADSAPSKEAACATFGLSDREGDLAVAFTRSASLKVAAARAGMAVNTARNHIRNVFSKCSVSSQIELSRLLTKLL
jgi:DNA-binding CsgD family transcriptional regulator